MPTGARDRFGIVELNLSRLVEIQEGYDYLLHNWITQD